MPRPYPDSAKRENFCGGWDFQKAQVVAAVSEGRADRQRQGKRHRLEVSNACADEIAVMGVPDIIQKLRSRGESMPRVVIADPGPTPEQAGFHGAVNVTHPVDRIVIDVIARQPVIQNRSKTPGTAN